METLRPAADDLAAPWAAAQRQLAEIAERTLFFVGGAPRSGTTWVQEVLDLHPDVSCRGEALFHQDLARPLDRLMAARRDAVAGKNATTFRHGRGYPVPTEADGDMLLGTAVLLGLRRQCAGAAFHAVGEKTPENVFLFPRLHRLFPAARFIGIARDPRDSLSSAWHFWAKSSMGAGGAAAMERFVEASLPAVEEGLGLLVAYTEAAPQACRVFTYEQMLARPEPIVAGLFRFLEVSDEPDLVAACVRGASFAAVSGRAAGEVQEGAFHRKGVAGDWAATFPPALGDRIVARLGWAYEFFGWGR